MDGRDPGIAAGRGNGRRNDRSLVPTATAGADTTFREGRGHRLATGIHDGMADSRRTYWEISWTGSEGNGASQGSNAYPERWELLRDWLYRQFEKGEGEFG
ncbi:hypothetical protein [Exiguobacterium sp. K1]|uniref:hypothetical protein n=1 Tax=Exiguobacterium sp. K1 TaxID=2980105 RepID=UPI00299F0D06|nr:hypothetical protein [Exiguobacterium sp. K1]MDX1260702.1 hypothetical protein [Exiguobacterium sp. K1]